MFIYFFSPLVFQGFRGTTIRKHEIRTTGYGLFSEHQGKTEMKRRLLQEMITVNLKLEQDYLLSVVFGADVGQEW